MAEIKSRLAQDVLCTAALGCVAFACEVYRSLDASRFDPAHCANIFAAVLLRVQLAN